uniref:(northern house mosquito) hypothetical protein n=1 Tax=Culex pipiens TaxID=7175 RepID=A0A8D8B0P0_CULPI
MGVGASNPGKHSGGSRRHHRGTSHNYQKNGWTQHYHSHSQTAASSTIRQPNPAQNQWIQPEDQPQPSVTRGRRSPGGVMIRQAPAAQPESVTITTRVHTPKNAAGGAGQQKRGNKPKIDYSTVECGVCGHTGHGTRYCHHRNQTCHICNEQGHIASVCKQKVHHEASRYKPRQVK